MKIVYIAGPYRAKTSWEQEQNVRRAEELAIEVARNGMMPLCTQSMCRFFHGECEEAFWLDGTSELLTLCDYMLLVPGWQESLGTAKEILLATERGIPIFRDLDELIGHRSEL